MSLTPHRRRTRISPWRRGIDWESPKVWYECPSGWNRPALAAAYHGSAVTLKALEAKQAGKLMDALGFIDAGVEEIDAALASEPGNLELRILRLENSMSLIETSPVDRKPQVREDLAALRAAWASLGPEQKAISDLDEGRLLVSDKRLSDALKRWRAVQKDAPDSEPAARARKLIARYGD